MPPFRGGKPYRWLGLAANTNVVTGLADIPFDVVETDGAWGPSTGGAVVECAIAGLYIVTLNVRITAGAATEARVVLNGDIVALDGSTRSCSASWGAQLDVGDVLELETFNTAARTLERFPTNALVTRVGPVRWT